MFMGDDESMAFAGIIILGFVIVVIIYFWNN
jgi:hypothetical protein